MVAHVKSWKKNSSSSLYVHLQSNMCSVRLKTLEYNQTLEEELRRKKERVESERARSPPPARVSFHQNVP